MMIVRLGVPLHQAKRKSFAVPLRKAVSFVPRRWSCQRLCTTPYDDSIKLGKILNFQIFLKINTKTAKNNLAVLIQWNLIIHAQIALCLIWSNFKPDGTDHLANNPHGIQW